MNNVCYVAACFILHLLTEGTVTAQGKWGDWTEWSSCSKTCGYGEASQERLGGTERMPQAKSCYMKECPSVGQWTDWTGWSSCTKHCDGGTRTRSRFCSSVASRTTDCGSDENGVQSENCNKESCPALPANFDITKCTEEHFICKDKLMCVPTNTTCDKKINCHDASDELQCWRRNRQRASGSGVRLSLDVMLVMFYAAVAFLY